MGKFDSIKKLKVRACFGTWTNGDTAITIKQAKHDQYKVEIAYQNRGEFYPKTYNVGYPEFFTNFLPAVLIAQEYVQKVITHPEIIEALKNEPKTMEELLKDLVADTDEEDFNRMDEDGFLHLF